MEIYLVNTEHGLLPMYDSDTDKRVKLKIGGIYACTIRKPRNPKLLKKFMGLIHAVFQNQDQIKNETTLRKQLLIQAGFYDEKVNEFGKKYPEAKSIDFESMEEFEFQEVYNRVLDVIVVSYSWNRKLIERELKNYM